MSDEELTLDELARRTQQEFATLRAEMATREDVGRILQAVQDIDLHLSSVASSWRTEFEALELRIKRLEHHLQLDN